MAATVSLAGILKKVRTADDRQVEAQFVISALLTAIKDHNLYEDGNYVTFQAMVVNELPFSPSTADNYTVLYKQYIKLGYTKAVFLDLMRRVGWRNLVFALRKTKKKVGYRAINNLLINHKSERDNQFNFNLYDKSVAAQFEATLSNFGMEANQAGHRSHLTTSLLALLEEYARLKAAEERRLARINDKAIVSTQKSKTRARDRAEQLELGVS